MKSYKDFLKLDEVKGSFKDQATEKAEDERLAAALAAKQAQEKETLAKKQEMEKDRLKKEEVELDEGYDKNSSHHKNAREMAKYHDGKATYNSDGSAKVTFHTLSAQTGGGVPTKLMSANEVAKRAVKDHGSGKLKGHEVHFSEEVEQVDELDRSTVASYLGKAGASLKTKQRMSDLMHSAADKSAVAYQKKGGSTAYHSYQANKAAGDRFSSAAANRIKGIATAGKKLADTSYGVKEEIDQIEEGSWSDFANKTEGKKPSWSDFANKTENKKEPKKTINPKTQLPEEIEEGVKTADEAGRKHTYWWVRPNPKDRKAFGKQFPLSKEAEAHDHAMHIGGSVHKMDQHGSVMKEEAELDEAAKRIHSGYKVNDKHFSFETDEHGPVLASKTSARLDAKIHSQKNGDATIHDVDQHGNVMKDRTSKTVKGLFSDKKRKTNEEVDLDEARARPVSMNYAAIKKIVDNRNKKLAKKAAEKKAAVKPDTKKEKEPHFADTGEEGQAKRDLKQMKKELGEASMVGMPFTPAERERMKKLDEPKTKEVYHKGEKVTIPATKARYSTNKYGHGTTNEEVVNESTFKNEQEANTVAKQLRTKHKDNNFQVDRVPGAWKISHAYLSSHAVNKHIKNLKEEVVNEDEAVADYEVKKTVDRNGKTVSRKVHPRVITDKEGKEEMKEQNEMLGFADYLVELTTNQKKIDKNNNGKLDAQDFKMLRKEATSNNADYESCPKCGKDMDSCAHSMAAESCSKMKEEVELDEATPTTSKPKKAPSARSLLNKMLRDKKKAFDQGRGWQSDAETETGRRFTREEVELEEEFVNGREYASHGLMHPKHAGLPMHKVTGNEVDFYAHGTGDKIQGKVTMNNGKHVHIRASKSSGGALHKFKVTPHLPKEANEEVEQIEERELSTAEMNKREEVVKSMKKSYKGFKDRYGSRAKEVMYATATNVAKKSK